MRRSTDDATALESQVRRLKVAQIFYTVSGIILLAAVVLILTFIYWFAYPYHPLTFRQSQLEARPSSIELSPDGASVEILGDYCKSDDSAPKEMVVTLVGEKTSPILPYNPSNTIIPNSSGCHSLDAWVAIPKILNVGDYYISIYARYTVNPVREEKVTVTSQKFTILQNGQALGPPVSSPND